MLFAYEGFSKQGGIYQIKNLVSGGVYIGSTKEFKCRWSDHKRSLVANKHKTKHLQNAYSKYLAEHGSDDFLEFSVLEVMTGSTKTERLVREEWWIEKLVGEGVSLYNTNKTPTKEPVVDCVMTEEIKRKRSVARKGKHFSPATEYKAGNVSWTKENGHEEDTRKLIGERSKKMWENPEVVDKLMKSRQSEEFRSYQSKRMRDSWEETREQRRATMNTPESKAAKSAKSNAVWGDAERRQKLLDGMRTEEARRKFLISSVGEEKAEKILDKCWLKVHVAGFGYKQTARILGVDRGTIKRWHTRLCG